jgi:hypothetical protein
MAYHLARRTPWTICREVDPLPLPINAGRSHEREDFLLNRLRRVDYSLVKRRDPLIPASS